jgi:hypothetical protein
VTVRRANTSRPAHSGAAATLGIGVAVALMVAGCSSSGAGAVTTKTSLKAVALSPADVGSATGSTVTAKLAQDGTSVASEQPTLQECSARFSSEKQRAQRLQQDYYDQPTRVSAGSEVVRYRSGGAAKAYAELTSALKHCATTKTQTISRSGLEKESVATTGKVLNGDGTQVYVTSVYQWRDDLLEAVYVYRDSATDGLGNAVALARAAAKRLNAAK